MRPSPIVAASPPFRIYFAPTLLGWKPLPVLAACYENEREARAGAVKVQVSSEIGDFAGEWPLMAQPGGPARTIFQARNYLEAWRNSIGAARGARLFFAKCATAAGAPLMLVPLALERRKGVRVLCFPDGGVCDYNAPVLFPEASVLGARGMHALWVELVARLPPFDLAQFEKMPHSVDCVQNPFRFLGEEFGAQNGHVLTLTGDWPSFQATHMHRPKESRRKRRRIGELGSLRFFVAETFADRDRLLEALFKQKTRRYLELRGVDGFERPGYREYFRAMTSRFGPSGEAHLAALELDGQIIAVHWGLVSADRFYCLMLAHEEGPWTRWSPGGLLIEDLIAWSFSAGLKSFDLGVGDAEWKRRLDDLVSPLWRAELPQTFAGKAYMEAARLRRAWRLAGARTDVIPGSDRQRVA